MEQEENKFSFGENWLRFIDKLDRRSYEQAKESLCDFLQQRSLQGKTFLDIGCGSGIFSMAAAELGAKKVVSIDADPKSIAACGQMKKKAEIENCQIIEGSILNKVFMGTLGKFDIVYAWGVLHHTGDMWQAISNAADLVDDKGLLVMAIYNRTWSSGFWLKFKKLYNRSGEFVKGILVWSILLPRIVVRLIRLKHPFKDKRGMSVYYDARDWAGGLPYEYASFEEICFYMTGKGFRLKRSKRTKSIGCNEFLFEKNKA